MHKQDGGPHDCLCKELFPDTQQLGQTLQLFPGAAFGGERSASVLLWRVSLTVLAFGSQTARVGGSVALSALAQGTNTAQKLKTCWEYFMKSNEIVTTRNLNLLDFLSLDLF